MRNRPRGGIERDPGHLDPAVASGGDDQGRRHVVENARRHGADRPVITEFERVAGQADRLDPVRTADRDGAAPEGQYDSLGVAAIALPGQGRQCGQLLTSAERRVRRRRELPTVKVGFHHDSGSLAQPAQFGIGERRLRGAPPPDDHDIDYKLNLTGLPELIQAEMAWMAHWQATDGTRASVLALSQLANVLRRAIRDNHPFPPSLRQMDWETASALQTWFYTTRWGRFPSAGVRARLRVVFRFARIALIAACHDGPWWELDYWHPRCDPRIPLSEREPMAHYGCTLTLITHPWLREAVKWCLGTMLDAGTLRWTTVSQERLRCLHRFDRWLQVAFDDPLDVLGDPAAAAGQAAASRRWDADPANRSDHSKQRRITAKVAPRQLNDDLRAVGELFEFLAANAAEAHRVLGSLAAPWTRVTAAHAASWFRQVSRIPHGRVTLNDEHYVDDHALGQITAALPLLGLPKDQQMPITRSDGQTVTADGMDDPQAMRMILLQILTGRRSSEIRLCDLDCLSAPTDRAVEAAEGEDIARFRYAQSKIDIAPDTILVDSEVVAIIEEQQHWVRERLPNVAPKHLFVQLLGNRSGVKPYPSGTYNWRLREFSSLVRITDGKGHPVNLSHTHRFRHTKLTRLAELGLPIHVLQRYAGHATPSMSMHYIAHEVPRCSRTTTRIGSDPEGGIGNASKVSQVQSRV